MKFSQINGFNKLQRNNMNRGAWLEINTINAGKFFTFCYKKAAERMDNTFLFVHGEDSFLKKTLTNADFIHCIGQQRKWRVISTKKQKQNRNNDKNDIVEEDD